MRYVLILLLLTGCATSTPKPEIRYTLDQLSEMKMFMSPTIKVWRWQHVPEIWDLNQDDYVDLKDFAIFQNRIAADIGK